MCYTGESDENDRNQKITYLSGRQQKSVFTRITEFDAVRIHDIANAISVVCAAARGRVNCGVNGSILVIGSVHSLKGTNCSL